MPASLDSIFSDLKKKIYKPVYFLAGEEPYYIDLISKYIEDNVLEQSEKDFNQIILYGDDTSVPGIVEISRRFPMMSNHQVVIVREAQSIRKIEELVVYTDNPLTSTILVINYKYKALDKRTKLYKSLESGGVYFESPRLRDYQVPAWIKDYLMVKGIRIETEAGVLLTEYLGTDLGKVANELDKLIISLPQGKPVITIELIEKNIGISKDFNNFELQKAVGEKNIEKANRIIKYFADNPKENPITLTISSLFSYFSRLLLYHTLKDRSRNNVASVLKVNPYFVREYEVAAKNYDLSKTASVISHLRKYDMKSKGVGDSGTPQGELLRELLFLILH
ncbi:MAG: DNA polymerase III subunit delta [Bacteroidales bacterium]|nr:DNA polymerase III subunit delta [Bacteroidales bacterium]